MDSQLEALAEIQQFLNNHQIRHGVTFPVCTAEDLVVHKAISERSKDWLDIEGVLDRRGRQLDQRYVMDWLEQFAQALERPELMQRYRQLLQSKGLA